MAIPSFGTFHYAGTVPWTKADRESGQWQLEEQFGPSAESDRTARGNRLRDNRLVGLAPTLRIMGAKLVLEAPSRHRSEIHSAAVQLAEPLITAFQGGDVCRSRANQLRLSMDRRQGLRARSRESRPSTPLE